MSEYKQLRPGVALSRTGIEAALTLCDEEGAIPMAVVCAWDNYDHAREALDAILVTGRPNVRNIHLSPIPMQWGTWFMTTTKGPIVGLWEGRWKGPNE